jgi:hypothetical protein
MGSLKEILDPKFAIRVMRPPISQELMDVLYPPFIGPVLPKPEPKPVKLTKKQRDRQAVEAAMLKRGWVPVERLREAEAEIERLESDPDY